MPKIQKSILTIFIACNMPAFSHSLILYAFNVGQANCCIIETDNHRILVDAGLSTKSHDNVVNFLKTKKPIDMVFISHPHIDHYSFFNYPNIWEQLKYELTDTKFFLSGNFKSYTSLISLLQSHNKDWASLETHEDKEYKWRNSKWFFYGRNTDRLYGNALSQIIRVEYASKKILLTGDADRTTLMSMKIRQTKENIYRSFLEKAEIYSYDYIENDDKTNYISPEKYDTNVNFGVDVIVCPHHGSASNGSLALTQNIDNTTDLIVCSDPYTKHKLPRIDSIIYWDQLKNPNYTYFPYYSIKDYFYKINRGDLNELIQRLGIYITGLDPLTAYYKIMISPGIGITSYRGTQTEEYFLRGGYGFSGKILNFKETLIKKSQPLKKVFLENPYFQNAGIDFVISPDKKNLKISLLYKKVNDDLVGYKCGHSDAISEELKKRLAVKFFFSKWKFHNFETVYALVNFFESPYQYKILQCKTK